MREKELERAIKEIEKAKMRLILKFPFLISPLFYLEYKDWNEIAPMFPLQHPTIGVSVINGKTHLWINPNYVLNRSLEPLLLHEVLHVILNHIQRGADKSHPDIWALAIDYVVDNLVEALGYHPVDPLPEYEKFANKSAEEIYNELLQRRKDFQKIIAKVKVFESGTAREHGDVHIHQPQRLTVDDVVETAQLQEMYRNAAIALTQHLLQQGIAPGELEEFIGKVLTPKLNIEALIAEFVETVKSNRYSFQRPNRKTAIFEDIFLPVLRGEKINIVFAVDCSGSMSPEELQKAYGLLKRILENFDEYTVYHFQVDADIQKFEIIENMDEFDFENIKVHGRGGTVFKCLKQIEEQSIDAQAIIFVSDLMAEFPDTAPQIPVLWIATKDIRKAPFGIVIPLED